MQVVVDRQLVHALRIGQERLRHGGILFNSVQGDVRRNLASVPRPGQGVLAHEVDELGHGQVLFLGALLVSELHEVVGRHPFLAGGRLEADGRIHLEVDAGVDHGSLHPDALGPDEELAAVEHGGVVVGLLGGVAVLIQGLHGFHGLLHGVLVQRQVDAVVGQLVALAQLRIVAQHLRTHPAQVEDLAGVAGGTRLVAQRADLVEGEVAIGHELVQIILVKQILVDVGDVAVHVQRDAVVLAVDVGALPRRLVVVLRHDARLRDQLHVVRIEHVLGHEVRNALDVHNGDIRDAGAGLHGQRNLLIQVVSGHRGVVHVNLILRGVERVDHALHDRAVAAGEDGPVVDFGHGHRGRRRQQHDQRQHKSQSLFHMGKPPFYFIPRFFFAV